MNRYAALLRGIMPANPNMKNDKLRAVFEGLGFAKVASVLSSGNVVFHSADTDVPNLEDRIQEALNRELGIPGGTIIRGYEQLVDLIDADPFADLTHCRETYLTATFLKQVPPDLTEDLLQHAEAGVRIVGYDAAARVVLSVIDNREPRTPNFMAWMEKTYSKDITTRTWLTVQKVVKKLE
ncbi:DUF1697 domain-containing protein [Nocardia australiensis]|uniref:DUF1697 domain-containing protein n=1 Tax=Nocardia australiensis TaxID=2887191 RepID=UPI001D14E339|nr:DUF1697 domain-containing protein [Nocardia australiensis]